MLDSKFVTLKDFPFAKANQVFEPNGYLFVLGELSFSAGGYRYKLKENVDYRNFDASKDSKLTTVSLPKSRKEIISNIGAIAALGYVIYNGYKKEKGAGYYIGYGLLGWIGGSIAGSLVGGIIAKGKEYTPEEAEKFKAMQSGGGSTPTTTSGATGKLTDSAIDAAAKNLEKIAKQMNKPFSVTEFKSRVNALVKKANQLEKDVITAAINLYAKPMPNGQIDIMKFMVDLQNEFMPLTKKYPEAQIEAAGKKVIEELLYFM